MTKASIISIGNEILNGQIADTNAAYISRSLLSIGIAVVSSYTVGDDIDSIIKSMKSASKNAELVIATGGLGPTDDDLTRQAFAKFLGTKLELQNKLLEKIGNFFTRRKLQMPQKCKIQAYIPAGAKAIVNNLGTAPGIMAEVEGKLFVAIPGVPSEMRQMFEESIIPELKKLTTEAEQAKTVIRKLRCFGTAESNIAELLGNLCQRGRNPQINCTVKDGIITLHIIATAEDKNQAEQMAEKDEKLIRNILGKLVYGTGEQTLAEVVGEKLAEQKKTIAIAESCTGGTLAKLLTDIPGSSGYFTYGWITYSNDAKITELGVPVELIQKQGAVSKEVAEAMAKGARKKAGTTYGVGITGIAGPTGGNKQKPVGLVYICIDSDMSCETKDFIFSHDRGFMRLQAAQTALNMLRLQL